MSERTRLRCAIYTRKSTEEGLEQAFNSLDAQHEACAAYIASQIGLGWKLVSDRYDDGGISGGTMERPALQRLLRDIRDKKVDVVVVYKIDRLTRSLMDFARIVETFDASNVSFVSITQQFNTTTSMGRLTLNVLLSFAQFEREVTAERIRDKIAASKKKGMWMGGTVPFGYRVEERKLVIDEPAAEEVRGLFSRYLDLGSVPALAAELNSDTSLMRSDTGQGRRQPAARVGTGKLYYILSNPIYVGQVRHGGAQYRGEHQPIIRDDLFHSVQTRLKAQAPFERGRAVNRDIHLLNGLLFDEHSEPLSPIHANKAGKRYRYYTSARLKQGQSKATSGWRLPAPEIEKLVLQQLEQLLADKTLLSRWIVDAGQTDRMELGLHMAARLLLTVQGATPDHIRTVIHLAILRIELGAGNLRLFFDKDQIVRRLLDASQEDQALGCAGSAIPRLVRQAMATAQTVDDPNLHRVELPISLRQRGVERRLVIEEGYGSIRRLDQPLIDMIARAHAYLEALTDGQGCGRKQVAERFGVHPEDVSRMLPLAFLAPGIVEMILTGCQPADLSVRHLTRETILPVDWAAQRRLLAI